jgi:uncharacterized membrane protein
MSDTAPAHLRVVPAEPDDDWPVHAADTIERVVGSVRDKTTGPAITVARGLVYGTFAAIVGTAVFVMLCVAAIRLLDSYLPQEVWFAYAVLGLPLVIIGWVLWRLKGPRNTP